MVTAWTEKNLYILSGVDAKRGDANDAVVSTPHPPLRASHLVFAVRNLIFNPEASHMFVKIKEKLCANAPERPPIKFNVSTKHNLKSNDSKQFTMRNGFFYTEANSQKNEKFDFLSANKVSV